MPRPVVLTPKGVTRTVRVAPGIIVIVSRNALRVLHPFARLAEAAALTSRTVLPPALLERLPFASAPPATRES